MGKPSSIRSIDKKKSDSSLNSNISTRSTTTKEDEMGKNKKLKHNKSKNKIFKMSSSQRKKHRKSQHTIQKLMEDFRNKSNTSIYCSPNNTIIVLDDTIKSPDGRKRKLSATNLDQQNKCLKIDEVNSATADDDVLIIHDETCLPQTPRKNINSAPIDCSTPLLNPLNSIANKNNNIDAVENFNVEVHNLTKEINRDSYLTIDLTTESNANKTSIGNSQFNMVIDLENTNDSQDCAFVSISNTSLSLSGESDVTVLHNPKAKENSCKKNMNKFVNGIAKLDASEKGKLLELITQKIFNGCKVPKRIKSSISAVKATIDQTTETAEDTYIKEVILGEKKSRNSIGSNIFNPEKDWDKSGLRLIVIDGSNVAMEHSKGRVFSVKGLQICIDYFLNRGHVVKAFVPRFRCKFGKSTDPRALDDLERRGLVVYTPSREIQGRMITSYDDRYIVQCAAEFDGVIVSGDNYRDLLKENPRWRFIIENRLLPFTWVNDMLMFPRDPLGRYGPTLEQFLRHPPKQTKPTTSLFN